MIIVAENRVIYSFAARRLQAAHSAKRSQHKAFRTAGDSIS
jgi:hypothetical protein